MAIRRATMLSDQKFYDLWNENPECLANDAGVLKLGRAIEQAAIAEQAAPAGEAVAWLVYLPSEHAQRVYDDQYDPGFIDDMTNNEDAEVTPLFTTPQPSECPRRAEPLPDALDAAHHEVELLQSQVETLTSERDRLILAVADHVTARGYLVAERNRADEFSQKLVDLCEKAEANVLALMEDKARAEAVIEKCKTHLSTAKTLRNLADSRLVSIICEALSTIADYQKGVK